MSQCNQSEVIMEGNAVSKIPLSNQSLKDEQRVGFCRSLVQNQNVTTSRRDRGCTLAKMSFRNILSGHLIHQRKSTMHSEVPCGSKRKGSVKKKKTFLKDSF